MKPQRNSLEDWQRAKNWPVRAQVLLGKTRMRLKDVAALSKGSVITLGHAVKEPVPLEAGGVVLWTGFIYETGGDYAIRIVAKKASE